MESLSQFLYHHADAPFPKSAVSGAGCGNDSADLLSGMVSAVLLPVFYMRSFVQFLEKAFYNLMTDEEKAKEDERNRDYASLEKKEQNENRR